MASPGKAGFAAGAAEISPPTVEVGRTDNVEIAAAVNDAVPWRHVIAKPQHDAMRDRHGPPIGIGALPAGQAPRLQGEAG